MTTNKIKGELFAQIDNIVDFMDVISKDKEVVTKEYYISFGKISFAYDCEIISEEDFCYLTEKLNKKYKSII